MSELRELLERVKAIDPVTAFMLGKEPTEPTTAIYNLLEAIVDEMEPWIILPGAIAKAPDYTCGECHEEVREFGSSVVERLRGERDEARAKVKELEDRNKRQRQTIEYLNKDAGRLKRALADIEHHHRCEAERTRERDEARVQIEQLKAAVEIGELVLGMRSDSSLHKEHDSYSVSGIGPAPQYSLGYQGAIGAPGRFSTPPTHDPTEALRASKRSECSPPQGAGSIHILTDKGRRVADTRE